ncbi:hypothetical protein BGZ65_001318 [Modicella reniformis]|uniref:NAD(P)-binding domain-containing protein n=1 Tax=Modicella reniformis TaxID=1440133 RepID=A0A9P6SUD2_9FUNG|nr:hypothetical protein BGZ65_001318 [Modicella reniformis]
MAFIDPPSPPAHRIYRARSLAAESNRNREGFYYSNELEYHSTSPFSTPSITIPPMSPEIDLYKRPTSPPLPASPTAYSKFPMDAKKETKAVQRQKKEQMVLKLQQQQREASERVKQERFERQQAKLERKQKKEAYAQMYQSQAEYMRLLEEYNRPEKRQQLSLPIHPLCIPSSSSSSSSSSTAQSSSSNTLLEHQNSQLTATNEIYYHSSRHYHRSRPSCHSDALFPHRHLDSISSTSSASSCIVKIPDEEKMRSFSLKSQSTKSMFDLRPYTGPPPYDYYSGYDSDETSMSRGWDSLMDTLHSPTMIPSPLNSPGLDSPCRDEIEIEPIDSSLANLNLSHDDSKNGNGKYLLVLGANGRTGIELVKQGLERNYRVTAFVRDDKVFLEDSSLRKNHNLIIVRGSPTCQADVDRCVEGQDVVVNVIGARLMSSDPTISSHSQVVLNNAMKKHGVRRLIVVTSYGCLGLRNYLISTKKLFSRMFMTGILKDKVLQEEIIQRDNSSLDWTIVRPITLKDGDLSEKYWVGSDELPSTSKVKVLTRRDLAHYLIGIINAPEEYHVIRSIAGKPKPSKVKQFCPFERRREAAELARQEKEMENQ